MSDELDEESSILDENSISELFNAAAKEAASAKREGLQEGLSAEDSAIQQNTDLINGNTQSQTRYNNKLQEAYEILQKVNTAYTEMKNTSKASVIAKASNDIDEGLRNLSTDYYKEVSTLIDYKNKGYTPIYRSGPVENKYTGKSENPLAGFGVRLQKKYKDWYTDPTFRPNDRTYTEEEIEKNIPAIKTIPDSYFITDKNLALEYSANDKNRITKKSWYDHSKEYLVKDMDNKGWFDGANLGESGTQERSEAEHLIQRFNVINKILQRNPSNISALEKLAEVTSQMRAINLDQNDPRSFPYYYQGNEEFFFPKFTDNISSAIYQKGKYDSVKYPNISDIGNRSNTISIRNEALNELLHGTSTVTSGKSLIETLLGIRDKVPAEFNTNRTVDNFVPWDETTQGIILGLTDKVSKLVKGPELSASEQNMIQYSDIDSLKAVFDVLNDQEEQLRKAREIVEEDFKVLKEAIWGENIGWFNEVIKNKGKPIDYNSIPASIKNVTDKYINSPIREVGDKNFLLPSGINYLGNTNIANGSFSQLINNGNFNGHTFDELRYMLKETPEAIDSIPNRIDDYMNKQIYPLLSKINNNYGLSVPGMLSEYKSINGDYSDSKGNILGPDDLVKSMDTLKYIIQNYEAINNRIFSGDITGNSTINRIDSYLSNSIDEDDDDYFLKATKSFKEGIGNLTSENIIALGETVKELNQDLKTLRETVAFEGIDKAESKAWAGTLFGHPFNQSLELDSYSAVVAPNNIFSSLPRGITGAVEEVQSNAFATSVGDLITVIKQSIATFTRFIDLAFKTNSYTDIGYPDLHGYPTTKVHDMVLTEDGRLIQTDPKDTLVALENPAMSLRMAGNSNVSGQTVGVISGTQLDKVISILETLARVNGDKKYDFLRRELNDIVKGAVSDFTLATGSEKNIFGTRAYLNSYTDNSINPFYSDEEIQAMKNTTRTLTEWQSFSKEFDNNVSKIENNIAGSYNNRIASIGAATLIGSPYDTYGLVDGQVAYTTGDDIFKNSKIEEFKENFRNSVQNYANDVLENVYRKFFAYLSSDKDDVMAENIIGKKPLMIEQFKQGATVGDSYSGFSYTEGLGMTTSDPDKQWINDMLIDNFKENFRKSLNEYAQNGLDKAAKDFRSVLFNPEDDKQVGGKTLLLDAPQSWKDEQEKAKNELNNRRKAINDVYMGKEDDENIRLLRTLLSRRDSLSNYISNIHGDPLRTASEDKLAFRFGITSEDVGHLGYQKIVKGEPVDVPSTGMLAKFETAREDLILAKIGLDIDGSEEEHLKATENYNDVLAIYNGTLTTLISTVSDLVKETQAQIALEEEKNSLAQESVSALDAEQKKKKEVLNNSDFNVKPRNNEKDPKVDKTGFYDTFKYSPIRTKEEQAEFLKQYSYFTATGNIEQSFRRTLFNRSVGYRQRQGVVGFAANMGYANSGTLASVMLGGFATGLIKATKGLEQFANESVKAYADIQSVRTNLGIVYGSQSQADLSFNEISQYAVKSPFGVEQVSEYAVLLKQSGVYATDLMDTLKQIGDVAGGNQQKFANIANAFAQIEAYGKATTRQLRQFATAGIPIYKELTKAYSEENNKTVSVSQIRKLTEDGKITSEIVERAFKNMTGAGGTFENAVEIGAKTWKARQQNLADAAQLAKAQVGEYLINIGGTGDNDSFAQKFLSIKEDLFGYLQNLYVLKNIDKNTNNIALKDLDISRAKEYLAALKASGASSKETKVVEDYIKNMASVYSPEMRRANSLNLYNTEKRKNGITDELDASLVIDTERWNTLKDYEKAPDSYDWHKLQPFSQSWFLSLFYGDENVKNKLQNNAFKAQAEMNGKYSQKALDKFNKAITEDQWKEIYTALSENYSNSNFDILEKNANKSNSLYSLKQKSDQLYEQTSKGKTAVTQKDIKEWNDKLNLYDRVSPLFTEQGQLIESFNGSLKDLNEAFSSGILEPLENISLGQEVLSRDYTENLSGLKWQDQATLEDRDRKWAQLLSNVRNLDAVKNASDINYKSKDLITEFQKETLGLTNNTTQEVQSFSEALYKLIYELNKLGESDLVSVVSQITQVRKLTERSKEYWDAHENTADPLWRRVASSSLGVDATLMRRTNMSAYGAVGQNLRNYERSVIQSVIKSALTSTGKFDTGLLVNGNLVNKYDNTQGFDWEKTYKNISDFTIALEQPIAVLQSYSSSLESELDSLSSFIANAYTTTEDGANIFDVNYEPYLDDLFEDIKARDVQAYSLLADSSGHLRDSALEAAKALVQQKTVLLDTTNALISLKEASKNIVDELRNAERTGMMNSGVYSKSSYMKGLTTDEQSKFFEVLDNVYNSTKLESRGVSRKEFEEKVLNGDFMSTLTKGLVKVEKPVTHDTKDASYFTNEEEKLKKAEELLTERDSLHVEALSIGNDTQKQRAWRDKYAEQYKKDHASELAESMKTAPATEKSNIQKAFDFAAEKYASDLFNSSRNDNTLEQERKTLETNKSNLAQRKLNNETFIAEDLKNNSLYNDYLTAQTNIDNANKLLSNLPQYILDITSANNANAFYDNMVEQGVFKRFQDRYTSGIDTGKFSEAYFGIPEIRGNGFTYGLRSVLDTNTSLVKGNNYKQQIALNALGINDKNMEQYLRESFISGQNRDGSARWFTGQAMTNVSHLINEYASIKNLNPNELRKQFGNLNAIQLSPNSTTDERAYALEKQKSLVEEYIEAIGEAKDKTQSLTEEIKNLSNSFKEAFSSSIIDGWMNSFKELGSGFVKLYNESADWNDIVKNISYAWKDAAQSMIDAIGPAMAQAGLNLISGGNWQAGIALVAASGVAGIMSGILSSTNNGNEDETAKLESLKDLLGEIIDQAKTDADYYQKNLLHENALSENYAITSRTSVHDALISNDGRVITTDPKDYLIATKNPGGLVSGNGNVTVNFTMIDKSTGASVSVQSVNQKRNSDGSIDIEAQVVAIMNKALASGDCDKGLAALSKRQNGKSYVG